MRKCYEILPMWVLIKKTHITIILYVKIHSSWGKYEELAQYLVRNIPREVLDQILTQIFPHKESKTYEEYSSREIISRGF